MRISKAKRTFEKGYLPNWTREIFTVSRIIQGSVLYRYKVEDYNGEELEVTFYESELQKVTKKDDVYEVEEILGYKKRRVGKKSFLKSKCTGGDILSVLIHGLPKRISFFLLQNRSLECMWWKIPQSRNFFWLNYRFALL